MRFSRSLFPMSGLAVALVACAPEAGDARMEGESRGAIATPAADPAAVRRAIDSANLALADAIQKEDIAAHTAIYASDAMMMMPNMPAAKGTDAIRAHATQMYDAADARDVKFTTQDLEVSGDLAVETGTFSMTITPKGGKAMEEKGKYLTVWKRQADGTWKIHRDISNSDLEAK